MTIQTPYGIRSEDFHKMREMVRRLDTLRWEAEICSEAKSRIGSRLIDAGELIDSMNRLLDRIERQKLEAA